MHYCLQSRKNRLNIEKKPQNPDSGNLQGAGWSGWSGRTDGEDFTNGAMERFVRTFEGITCGRFERDNQTELRVITGKRVGLVLAMAAVQTTEDSAPPCGTDNNMQTWLRHPTLVFHSPPPGIDYPTALLHKVLRRWIGFPDFRLADSKPGSPGRNLSRNRSTSRLTGRPPR